MSVELRIKFPACVVMKHGHREIAGCAIVIRTVLPHTRSGVPFQFLQRIGDGSFMRLDEPGVAAQDGHNGGRTSAPRL
jgi:hypothetical protein